MTALKTLGVAVLIACVLAGLSWLRNGSIGSGIAVADLIGFLVNVLIFWLIAYLIVRFLPRRQKKAS